MNLKYDEVLSNFAFSFNLRRYTMVRTVIKEQLDACADITEALRSALVTVEAGAHTRSLRAQLEYLRDHIPHVRAQLEHFGDTSTG